MKKWAKNYHYCIGCFRSTVPHVGNGLCRTCYNKRGDAWRNEKAVEELKPVKVPEGWRSRAWYDRHVLKMSAAESIRHWPFDWKPTEQEWLSISARKEA